MSEIIDELPVDSIPLRTEEKDVFDWLYPTKDVTTSKKSNGGEKSPFLLDTSKFIPLGFFLSVFTFCAIYPKFDSLWKKIIPFSMDSILFSTSKIVLIYLFLFSIYCCLLQIK